MTVSCNQTLDVAMDLLYIQVEVMSVACAYGLKQ